jgi:hypothetical protein
VKNARTSPKLKHQNTYQQNIKRLITVINKNKTKTYMKKERKNLWSEVHKINWRRKLYNASPYHTDVQPIPPTLSSSKLHTPLEGYFAILCRIAGFEGSSYECGS